MQAVKGAGGTPEIVAEAVAVALLLAALVFGGGPHGLGDGIVHLVACAALMLGSLRWRNAGANGPQRALLFLLVAAAVLVALSLVPLSAALFASFPGRADVLADLQAAGAAPAWLPLTLDPWGSVRALLALLTFTAMWLLVSTLAQASRVRVLQWALLAGGVLALLGFAQAAGGANAPRAFAFHHEQGAIGLFANRNHFGTLMAMLVPFAFAAAVAARSQRTRLPPPAWFTLATLLALAGLLSFSRAGMSLVLLSALASLLCVLPATQGGRARWAGALAFGVAAIAAVQVGWPRIAARMEQDALADTRWQYLDYGLDTLQAWLPWGSGLGSFRWVYAPHEPVGAMIGVYADRAHNDLLQVGIELGVPGLALIAALLAVLAWAWLRNLRAERANHAAQRPWLAAAAIAVAIPLLHSLVDYPLRTLACAVVFALAAAVLCAGPAPTAREARR